MSGTANWRVAGATTLGDYHARERRLNQDAILWAPADGTGARIVAAVSDGHGAALHFRSDRGARIAVERAVEVLAWHMDDDDPGEEALPGALVAAWRAAVVEDMRADPADRSGERPGALLAPYGATLVAAAATASELMLLQIGDGDLLLIYPGANSSVSGRVVRPFAPDPGLIGEQTYSLCMDDAEGHVRTASLWRDEGGDWPLAIVMATDGVSKSFRDDAAFHDALRQLVGQAAGDWNGFEAELADWLAAISHRGSGDDASLCLALNLVGAGTLGGGQS